MTKYSTRILLALSAVAFSLQPLTILSAQSGPNTSQTIVGEVTDTMCAPSKSHSGMMAKMPNMGHDSSSCTKECAQIGAKYVILDNQTGKIYEVDDQKKIVQFAGHRVRVMGTLTANRIKVTDITALG